MSIVSFFFISSSIGQDAVFSNYQLTPQLINPSLTGQMDQDLRVFSTYRNQWSSLVQDGSFRSLFIGAETKIPISNNNTTLGLGLFSLMDRAGSASFETNEYKILASISKTLVKTDKVSQEIALGFNFGLGKKGLSDTLFWPTGEVEVVSIDKEYADFSTGFHWAFDNVSGLKSELGIAVFHFNKPNGSLSQNFEAPISPRYVAHASVNIPLGKIEIIPSYLYMDQGPHHQSLLGIAGKIKTNGGKNWIQIGVLGRMTNSFNNENEFTSYVINSSFKFKDFLLGFSYDRFKFLNTNSFEFSFNYFINYRNEKTNSL